MYTIGQISKLVNISPNALRYYDEISLLKPVEQDKSSGYRYYTNEQIRDLLFIQEFKYYGFSLNEIRNLIKQDQKTIIPALEKKINMLKKIFDEDGIRIKILQKKLSDLDMKGELNMDNKQEEKTILLVEDVAFERMLMKEMLASHGYINVIECINGKELVEKYDEYHPDIVITGITMPIMDGLYAMKLIREKHKDAKAIFCSYMSQLFIMPIALKTEACYDFIPKPIKAERLISSIMKAFELTHEIPLNKQMDIKLIDMIDEDIRREHSEFIQNYRLNQKDADAFFEISSIEEYKQFRKTLESEYVNFNETKDYDTTCLVKCSKEAVDFNAVGFHIALQKEINRQLANEFSEYGIRDLAVDFVNPYVINDYIIKSDTIKISLLSDNDCIGGLCYPCEVKIDIDKFMSELIRLQNIAIKGLNIKAVHEIETFDVQTEYILSTFLDENDNKISLFVRNDIY